MSSIGAFFDLDGTLTHGDILGGFLNCPLARRKARTWRLAFWTTCLPSWLLSKSRLISEDRYRTIWANGMGSILKGATEEEALDSFRWLSDKYIFNSLHNCVVEILNQHKQSGHVVAIISSTFSPFLQVVGQGLGTTYAIGTKLEVVAGRYTGKVVKPLCFGENKTKLLKEFIRHNGLEIDLPSSFAYSDSIFDLPLLKLVGNPVATYPDRRLRQLAEHNSWQVLL